MAATMATMAILNAKCLNTINPHKNTNNLTKPTKPISHLSIQNLPKGLTISSINTPGLITSSAIAGAFFSALSSSDPAFAAQQLADIAADDSRGLALLLPLIPAILWVLYNILQPALNQLNRMKETKGVIVGLGLGLGGWAAHGLMSSPPAAAASVNEIGVIAAEATSDSRGQLLLFVVAPAILWVAYNILQPALNQLNRMRSE